MPEYSSLTQHDGPPQALHSHSHASSSPVLSFRVHSADPPSIHLWNITLAFHLATSWARQHTLLPPSSWMAPHANSCYLHCFFCMTTARRIHESFQVQLLSCNCSFKTPVQKCRFGLACFQIPPCTMFWSWNLLRWINSWSRLAAESKQ